MQNRPLLNATRIPPEKNNHSHKLKDFAPVYCINLNSDKEKWGFMEDQFKYWGVRNYTRVTAYDGRVSNLREIIEGGYPDGMISQEVGCTTSHLKAIKQFYDSGEPYAIIMEDDCELDLVNLWNFSWSEFFDRIPYDWDVCQLAVICTSRVSATIHKRFVDEFSTACYLVTRHHAEKLIRLHCSGENYKLDNGVKPRAVADELIYNSGNTYTIPIFLYNNGLESSIHPDHIELFHKKSYDAQLLFWKEIGSKEAIDVLMKFDPLAKNLKGVKL